MKFFENLGVITLIGVWFSLAIWGVLQGFLESKSLFASVSIVVVWIGVFVLLVTAIMQRYKESKNDIYKDVEI